MSENSRPSLIPNVSVAAASTLASTLGSQPVLGRALAGSEAGSSGIPTAHHQLGVGCWGVLVGSPPVPRRSLDVPAC